MLAACFQSGCVSVQGTYEEPHGCAETAGGDSVERPDRRDADGVAAVCVRDGVRAGHCDVRLLYGSQLAFAISESMHVLYAIWVSRAGGLVATSLSRSPAAGLYRRLL